MSLGKLLPNTSHKKQEEKLDDILYLAMVRWGWSYEQFCNTPIPVLFRLIEKQQKVDKEEEKQSKKKK